jgi:isoleucyl-tRNA synthetase
MTIYKEVPSTFDPPNVERKILRFWKDTDAFTKRMALNQGKEPWSFIDGPITANNPMGVHHAWGRTYKDLFQRFNAMKGFNVRYQNGFDCQGLWVEVEVEKEFGFASKRDIEQFGIDKFVNKCKERVLRFSSIQTEQSIRLGYWMDWNDTSVLLELAKHMDHPEQLLTVKGAKGNITDRVEQIVGKLGTSELGGSYFTFSNENNYTIWATLKKCHERGWIYKGRDVLPWCPRCSTALSQHEIATEGYRELTHPGLTIKLPLKNRTNESLLVWTTTPWTLTANVSAAVHPDMDYVKVGWNNEILYLGKNVVDRFFRNTPPIFKTLSGRDMEGWTYDGPFDTLLAVTKDKVNERHKIILWEEVSETEGTGIVHIAPGCGKEDFDLGIQYDLPAVAPLDEYGLFKNGFGWLTGSHVYKSAEPIIKDLRARELVFKLETYRHRYPVCWRCGNELVFRLVAEWFISMGKKLDRSIDALTRREIENNLRYQIMEVAKKVRWIPSYGLQQELDWLLNMEDWMISKKRYWGLALPIWECKKCGSFDVIGGENELKQKAVQGWENFEGHTPHRPWIDTVQIMCSTCGAIASRIPDVGNPWLDAGIVAYSTLDYRHNRKEWQKWFPADFICESLAGQFRNWFYSMLTMSTILERKPPFLTCLGHGTVLAEDGREMHKSWGNAIWFNDAVETMGADIMRWMYCINKADADLLFGYSRADEVKRSFFIPLWNIYNFFVTYANLDAWTPKAASSNFSLLDRWVLSKLHILIQNITTHLDDYDAYNATIVLQRFVEELSTWYIRRSRRRFWKSDSDEDKKAAYTTLYACLTTLIQLLAPFVPFIAEEIYQNIVRSVASNSKESVHHNNWPVPNSTLIDEGLMIAMDTVIKVSSLGRAARNKAGVKLRQPLAEARLVAKEEVLKKIRKLKWLVEGELNVKKISFTSQADSVLNYKIRLLTSVLGKKYGALLNKIRTSITTKDANTLVKSLKNGESLDLKIEGHVVSLLPTEVVIETVSKDGWMIVEDGGIMVGINILITDDLENEGLAKDIVRRIQNQRKAADFIISDEIETYYITGPKLSKVFDLYREYIAAETLSKALNNAEPPGEAFVEVYELGGEKLLVGLLLSHKKDNEA